MRQDQHDRLTAYLKESQVSESLLAVGGSLAAAALTGGIVSLLGHLKNRRVEQQHHASRVSDAMRHLKLQDVLHIAQGKHKPEGPLGGVMSSHKEAIKDSLANLQQKNPKLFKKALATFHSSVAHGHYADTHHPNDNKREQDLIHREVKRHNPDYDVFASRGKYVKPERAAPVPTHHEYEGEEDMVPVHYSR